MKTRSVEKSRKTKHHAKHVHWNDMNRKQRREMMRKIQSADLSLEVVHPDAAGIHIGNESHYVAVPPDRDSQPVRRSGCTTAELKAMADWLNQCGIYTVAMQSTGIYWIAVFDILEAAGLEVYLVNARAANFVGFSCAINVTVCGTALKILGSRWLISGIFFSVILGFLLLWRPRQLALSDPQPASYGAARRVSTGSNISGYPTSRAFR